MLLLFRPHKLFLPPLSPSALHFTAPHSVELTGQITRSPPTPPTSKCGFFKAENMTAQVNKILIMSNMRNMYDQLLWQSGCRKPAGNITAGSALTLLMLQPLHVCAETARKSVRNFWRAARAGAESRGPRAASGVTAESWCWWSAVTSAVWRPQQSDAYQDKGMMQSKRCITSFLVCSADSSDLILLQLP